MQKQDRWKEQMSFYRFWNNEKVTEEALALCMEDHCRKQCEGKAEVLPIEAAGEMNTGKQRITDKEGLGPVGNGRDLGFFCHPAIAADPEDKTVIGCIDLYLRGRKAKKKTKKRRHSEREAFETKEIYRRAERAIAAMRKLGGAVNVTAVQDREGDLYESYALLKANGVNWVIRANHDRKVRAGNGESVRLKEYLDGLAAAERFEIVLQRRGKKTETVPMELRFAKAEVERPERKSKQEREKYPETVTMRVVQAKQEADSVRPGEAGVEWNLYTSHPVENAEAAHKIIEYYRSRWLIEELFRTVKSKGVKYEESALETGRGLRKLFVMALMAAVQILQLRQARDGKGKQKSSLVFDAEQLECMEDISRDLLEGNTEKQKNPYRKEELAWAAWVIARLGGWKVYNKNRPPGVITLYDGWTRFQNIFTGWLSARNVYKR